MSGPSANLSRSQKRQIVNKVIPKVEKDLVQKLNKKHPRKEAKAAAKVIKDRIVTRVLGKLENINYEGALLKYGPKGADMVHSNAEICEDKAKFYALCLALPSVYQSKIPDGYRRKTAKYHSHRVFEIKANSAGQFAFCVQPKIGNFDNPFHFNVALCLPDALLNPQDYDFTSVSAYEAFVGAADSDLRVDPNYTALTAELPSFTHFVSAAAGTGDKPFSDSAGISALSYNSHIAYDVVGGFSTFTFPKGNYYIQLMAFTTNVSTASGSSWNITNTGGSWTNELSEIVTGTTPAITRTTVGILYNATSDTLNRLTIRLNGAAVTTATAQMVAATILPNNTAHSVNSGLVGSIRPCAMSVLTSYNGPLLQNGGQIAGALVPGEELLSNFFTNAADDPGAFRSWQTIASLNEANTDNPLNLGNYTTWRQDDVTDFEFFSPSRSSQMEYQGIVVAGTWNPGSDPIDTDAVIARVEIDIVYEIRTEKTLLPKDSYIGSQQCIDYANQYLAGLPISSENKIHMDTFKKWFGYVSKAAKVFTEVAPFILAA